MFCFVCSNKRGLHLSLMHPSCVWQFPAMLFTWLCSDYTLIDVCFVLCGIWSGNANRWSIEACFAEVQGCSPVDVYITVFCDKSNVIRLRFQSCDFKSILHFCLLLVVMQHHSPPGGISLNQLLFITLLYFIVCTLNCTPFLPRRTRNQFSSGIRTNA